MRSENSPTGTRAVWPLSVFFHLVFAGIVVLFLALSLAYLFNEKQHTWLQFDLPRIFWLSSVTVIAISVLMQRQIQLYVKEKYRKLRRGYIYIFLLACIFVVFQWTGWQQLHQQGITLDGTPSSGYLYVITGLHILHVAVGIIMLSIAIYRAFGQTKDAVLRLLFFTDPIRRHRITLLAHYWHTIDFLWIYLFLVFLFMHS